MVLDLTPTILEVLRMETPEVRSLNVRGLMDRFFCLKQGSEVAVEKV